MERLLNKCGRRVRIEIRGGIDKNACHIMLIADSLGSDESRETVIAAFNINFEGWFDRLMKYIEERKLILIDSQDN